MNTDQTVEADKAKSGYPTWYKWKDSPNWDEISERINSLLRRGATTIHIYDANFGLSSDYEMVIVDGELNATEASEAFNTWMAMWWQEVDEDLGFDWKTQPEPFRVP